jgi:predicted permease
MFDLAFLVAPTFAAFSLGIILNKTGIIRRESVDFLLKLIFALTLPALMLSTLPLVELTSDFLYLPLISTIVILVTFAASLLAGRLLGMRGETLAVLLIGTTVMNLGIAMPFIKSFYGDEGLSRLFMFDLPNGLSAFTLSAFIAGRYGASKGRAVWRKFAASPPLWALAAGMGMNLLSLRPYPIAIHVLNEIGELTIPLLLLALGASVRLPKTSITRLLAGISLRMAFGMVTGLILVELFGLEGINRAIAVICASAPAGYNTLMYSSLEKLDIEYAASLVSATMIAGMLLIPALLSVL